MTSELRSAREESYAELVVKVGAGVVAGTVVHLRCSYEHAHLARRIVEHAYAAGARRVLLDYEDPHARLSALKHAPEDALRDVAGWELARAREFESQGAALIRLTGSSDPHLFDGIDPTRMAAVPIELAA